MGENKARTIVKGVSLMSNNPAFPCLTLLKKCTFVQLRTPTFFSPLITPLPLYIAATDFGQPSSSADCI